MLKSIDILIGLSVVMLVASMAVTVMTGFYTYLRNMRGNNLQQGIGDLLRLINPQFTADVANKIAEAVLTHPLIREAEGRMGTVIHREELTKLLMELAAGNGPHQLEEKIQTQLKTTLAEQGITDPEATLINVRSLCLRLEKSNPELSQMARTNLALLHEAESHFIGKINTWFDQTMDRVSQRFTLSMRVVTFVCGLLLAAVLQLDTVAIVNRISVDDALRQSLVSQAAEIVKQPPAAGQTSQAADLYGPVVRQGVIWLPNYPQDFVRFAEFRHDTGILFTALLLSLGAPFWYNALKQLLQLRSKIAQKDDVQRDERQSTQAAVLTPAGPAAVTPGA